ncbi:MAG: glutamate-1-semialdehyde 2,1-aminomutase [Chthoniobacterales bacterium]|nr:glutamate-1-semialdehyde 2,1-aminomutase [Chthoniobacterales bacterium]
MFQNVPSLEKVRIVNSGTEETMSCIRLARGFTNRPRILKFNGCYHGHVDSLLIKAGSGPLTLGQPDSGGIPHELASLTSSIPFNDISALRTYFEHYGSQTAAVILEPIPANAGLYLPTNDFLHELRSLCSSYNTILIFDEVMTGFRVHPGGAQALYQITPDLTALGKVIGGGLPVGAFGGRAEIMDRLAPDGDVYQAGTLSGNPITLAAGIAQLNELFKTNSCDYLESIGAQLEESLRPYIKNKPVTFHRIGSMFCLYFHPGPIHNLETARQANSQFYAHFFHSCLQQGVYLPPSQFETCFLSTAHDVDAIEKTSRIFVKALKETLGS